MENKKVISKTHKNFEYWDLDAGSVFAVKGIEDGEVVLNDELEMGERRLTLEEFNEVFSEIEQKEYERVLKANIFGFEKEDFLYHQEICMKYGVRL